MDEDPLMHSTRHQALARSKEGERERGREKRQSALKFIVQGLRDLTTEHGALLCFDEVMTGFR